MNFETAEGRALYILAKKFFGSMSKLADHLKCSRQRLSFCAKEGLPIKYASYLGRKLKVNPGILAYENYLLMGGEQPYPVLLEESGAFSDEDQGYILKGIHIKDKGRFLKEFDKKI